MATREFDKETLIALLPVMQAWIEGKAIQYKGCNGEWFDVVADPYWETGVEYRIKPERIKVEGWVNIYAYKRIRFHKDKATADKRAADARIACVPVTIPYARGEGL